MLGYNNSLLLKKQIHPKFHFFYQIWTELLNPKTHDSYQYKLMNSISCLEELKQAIELRLNNFSSSDNNIKDCTEESAALIKNDVILHKYHKEIANRLQNSLFKKPFEQDYQKRALKYQIEYALNQFKESYHQNCIQELENAMNNDDSATIEFCSKQIISVCIYLGWSNQFLYNHIRALHNSIKNNTAWDNFKSRLLSGSTRHIVYFPIKIRDHMSMGQQQQNIHRKNIDELNNLGLNIQDSDIIILKHQKAIANKNFESNTCYAELSIEAYDPYSASIIAIGKISDALNLLSFYNIIEPWNIRDIRWGVLNPSPEQIKWIKSSEIFETYNNIGITTAAYTKAKEKLNHYRNNENEPFTARLISAFSYANIAKTSYSSEEKFINLWVALESFCRSDVYQNIILNILETVPAALCSRYMYGLYRNFIEDCKRCGIELIFSDNPLSSIVYSDSKEQQVRKLLDIFRNETLYSELCEKCSVNHLLSFRCNELYQLTDKEKMITKVKAHYTNIRRHLTRLYRFRNEIAHNAIRADNSLLRCTEHLEDYLETFISISIMYSAENKTGDIKLIFEMIKDNYQEFCDIAEIYTRKKSSYTPISKMEAFFKTGIIHFI